MIDEIDISILRKLCSEHKIQWTNHIIARLLQRGILQADVENAIITGEIIEQYPDDYPNPSCLVLGTERAGKRLHVVCGINDGFIWMITAYYPDFDVWNKDLKTRKKGMLRK